MQNNAIEKAVTVNLGKTEVSLVFNWNAIALLEEKTEISLPAAMAKLKTMPFATSRLFVWAGVQHQLDVSLEEVGSMMSFGQTKEIVSAIVRAVSLQLGNPDLKQDGDQDPNGHVIPISG